MSPSPKSGLPRCCPCPTRNCMSDWTPVTSILQPESCAAYTSIKAVLFLLFLTGLTPPTSVKKVSNGRVPSLVPSSPATSPFSCRQRSSESFFLSSWNLGLKMYKLTLVLFSFFSLALPSLAAPEPVLARDGIADGLETREHTPRHTLHTGKVCKLLPLHS